MNSSRKIIRDGVKDVKKNNGESGLSGDDKKRIVIGGIFAIIVIALCVVVGIQSFKGNTVLTVNKEKFTMDDLMYPIYEVESQYASMDQMYQYYMGTSVWDASYSGTDANVDSSATNKVGLKQQIIDETTEYEILYREATKAGYKLTDEEKSQAKTDADDALKGLTFTQKLKLSISKNKLVKLFEKRALATRYKDDQKAITDGQVDEEAAKASVVKDDYKSYDVQYYYVKTVTKEDTDLKPEKLEKRKKQLEALYEKAQDDDNKFAELIDEDDDENVVSYETASFTEADGWDFITKDKVLTKIKELEKGEISEIIEDDKDNLLIFVKMKDNTSTEAYDKALEEAVTTAQTDKYNEWYTGIQEAYKVVLNNDIWDGIEIGTVTTSIVTLEDLEKIAELKATPEPEGSSEVVDETATSATSEEASSEE
ncbi:MAG: SurA N-terminal domain-containing protein [Lachnospiraceae bacterium]|nr:SurA N-terminal domain-containing protein [Lachnospiraceae bacterium]